MKKYLFLFLLLPLMSFQGLHKFYVSVTEIEYNTEAASLQIISRVFIDDMEKLLKERYNKELFLTKDEEHPSADGFLKKYIEQKLKISVNGKAYPLNYLGKKYDNDILVLFIEAEKVPPLQSVKVQNEVLTDVFPDQKNVVHVEYKGKTQSLLLTRDKETGTVNFRN